MKIAVIGAGNIGGTLGRKWAEAGHEVVFGVRDPGSPKARAALEATRGARAATAADAIAFGEAVLIATPAAAVEETVRAGGAALNGKIVIDATNRFGAPVINAVGEIAAHAPEAKVYRAFNSLGWEVFAVPVIDGVQVDHFYCGPDDEGRAAVERLIAEIGVRPVRVGGLDVIHLVDNLGALWVHFAFRQGMGRHLAFKMLTDTEGSMT